MKKHSEVVLILVFLITISCILLFTVNASEKSTSAPVEASTMQTEQIRGDNVTKLEIEGITGNFTKMYRFNDGDQVCYLYSGSNNSDLECPVYR